MTTWGWGSPVLWCCIVACCHVLHAMLGTIMYTCTLQYLLTQNYTIVCFSFAQSGVCLFNYNIGFFTFILGESVYYWTRAFHVFGASIPLPYFLSLSCLVFASVGGMYVFLSTVINFITRSVMMLSEGFLSFVHHETRIQMDRFAYSMRMRKADEQSLLTNDSDSDSESDDATVNSERLLVSHVPTDPEHKD